MVKQTTPPNDIRELVDLVEILAATVDDSSQDAHLRQLAARSLRRIRRELLPFTVPPHRTVSANYVSPGSNDVQLHVGCGTHLLEGFINIDVAETADLRWDVRASLPFQDDTINLVFSEHMLEHMDFDLSAKKFCSECHRVLREGGRFILGVPDAESIIRAYVENDGPLIDQYRLHCFAKRALADTYLEDFDIVSLVFHDEYAHEKYNPHFWGYSGESLCALLRRTGFRNAAVLSNAPAYSNRKRQFGSLYVEAYK